MPATPSLPARNRWRRRAYLAVGGIVAATLTGLAALPSLVGTGFVRAKILAKINEVLAPGRLEVTRFEVSWTGPTRLIGFRLVAPDGAQVIEAPVAELDRSLGGLLFRRGGAMTLAVDGASLVIVRHDDGTLDLVEALRSVIARADPTRDLTIRVTHGSLTFRAGGLIEPFEARTADLNLRIMPAPQPTTWTLRLGHAEGGGVVASGSTNRWTARDQDPSRADLALTIAAKNWPFAGTREGLATHGHLDGSIELGRAAERWSSRGSLRSVDLNLMGRLLAGDTLQPGPVTVAWDLDGLGDEWIAHRLAVDSALGSIEAGGGFDPRLPWRSSAGPSPHLEGRLDLAGLARQIPHALRLRPDLIVEGGAARIVVGATGPERATFHVEATIADLVARAGDRRLAFRDPASLAASVDRAGAAFVIKDLTARTAFLTASARGRLDDLTLTGSVDLGALRRDLGDWFDLGRFDGSGRADLAGGYQVEDQRFTAQFAVSGHDLRVEGITSSPIIRPLATLNLAVSGRSNGTGWPDAWDRVEGTADSGGSSARVTLDSSGPAVAVQARLVADLPGLAPDRRGEATLAATWTGGSRHLRCDRLVARLLPVEDDDATAVPVELIARGEYDGQAGTLRFDPISVPGSTPSSIRLAPEGIRASGLNGDLAGLRVDAGFEGNLPEPTTPTAAPPATTAPNFWTAAVTAQGADQAIQFSAQAEVGAKSDGSKPAARSGSLRLVGSYSNAEDRIDLTDYRADSVFGSIIGAGRVEDVRGARRFDLQGEVVPDFAAITAWLGRQVEPAAQLKGRPRPFQARGDLAAETAPLDALEGEIGFDLVEADIYGIKLGATPIVVRARGGQILVDPISTTLNEGQIRLEPEVVSRDPSGAAVLRLGKNSSIRDARINDEVSRRVLAFVAPVLEGATRASGRVSVDLDRAEFPLTAGRSKAVQVDGLVVFNDVAFAPGELANALLGAIGRRDSVLRLDRPVTLTIADGRVNQSGLSIPVGNLTRIDVGGWVDFDRNLALTATLPVTPALLGNNAFLTDIAAGTRVSLPIGGTLDHPSVDREAFTANLKELGKSLLTRGATRGALELLMRVGKPRDTSAPASPPPSTPAERKALRQERKIERKSQREVDPPMTPDP